MMDKLWQLYWVDFLFLFEIKFYHQSHICRQQGQKQPIYINLHYTWYINEFFSSVMSNTNTHSGLFARTNSCTSSLRAFGKIPADVSFATVKLPPVLKWKATFQLKLEHFRLFLHYALASVIPVNWLLESADADELLVHNDLADVFHSSMLFSPLLPLLQL